MTLVKIKRKRLKVKRILALLVCIILIIILPIIINNDPIDQQLKELNYNEESINKIKEKNLTSYIINNEIYADTLNAALVSTVFNENNINTYLEVEYKDDPNFIYNINNLVNMGYDSNTINIMYQKLNFDDIKIIMNKKYIIDINQYLELEYFKIINIDRYLENKTKWNSIDKIVTYVNIGLDRKFYSSVNNIEDPNSITVLVNKYNKLPEGFVPNNLEEISSDYSGIKTMMTREARIKFEDMCEQAKKENLNIIAISAYRSYNYQQNLYQNYVLQQGQEIADTYSARAGYSEHQTGLAVDVSKKNGYYTQFESTDEFNWMIKNSYKYGFILRYTKESEKITGYIYEPWHYRYVGVDIAKYIHENNITYDEYYIKFLDK